MKRMKRQKKLCYLTLTHEQSTFYATLSNFKILTELVLFPALFLPVESWLAIIWF